MQISKQAWHYRLLSKVGMLPGWWRDNNHTDLCTYMRTLFFACLLLALGITAIAFYPYGWYVAIHYGWPQKHPTPLMIIGTMFFILDNIVIGLFVALGLLVAITKWRDKQAEKKMGEEYKPGIFVTWLKALKQKTCPIVTYGDEP